MRRLHSFLAALAFLVAIDASAEVTIEHKGVFIQECGLPGEGRDKMLHPAHPFCAQLSEDRFLWIYQTRGFEGVDSEHSIIYELRSDRPDGPVLKEGFVSRYREDWDARGTGELFIKSHGHPKVLGVPSGAVDEKGEPLLSANVFLATWYVIAARRDPETGVVDRVRDNHIEARHFRLKDDGSDIEWISPEGVYLREKGFEKGDVICSIDPPQKSVNQWLRPPTALNAEMTRFADALHFPGGVAAVEIAWNSETGLYEWVRTGPLASKGKPGQMMEGSLNRLGESDWILACRARGHHWGKGAYGFCVGWYRTSDPFADWGEPTFTKIPSSYCPKPVHLCPDGVLRVFSGHIGGGTTKRNPLFCWDIDPDDGFSSSNQRILLDMREKMQFPMVGFAKLSPVVDNRQILTIRVSTMLQKAATEKYPAIDENEFEDCAAYYSVLTYDPPVEDTWRFGE